ncbi:MAG: outer membrane beta-barrel protein [Saprospiraceae bacterium]
MKNNFLIFTAFCFGWSLGLPAWAIAQSAFGIQGGLHMSNATVDGPTPFVASAQGNFFLGFTARTPLNGRWALNTDAQFTKRGFFLYQVRSMSEHRMGVQALYADVAARMEYNLFKNIGLELGSYAGYRLAEYDLLTGSDHWVKAALPLTDAWDLGLQAGAIAHFQRWAAFVRYSHGVKAVARLEITDVPGTVKIFNRGLQVGLSYAFF